MAGMQPKDVYQLTGVGDPRISPDGRMVAYVVWRLDEEDNEQKSAIWLRPLDGSAPARQLTEGKKRDSSPRWSPDGARLAYVSSREGGAGQLHVMDMAGGEPRKLTDVKEDVTDPRWSPDGTKLLFHARVRAAEYEDTDDRKRAPRRVTRLQYKLDNVGWVFDRRRHLFVVPADGSSEATQLTDGDFEDHSPAWSADGSTIAFVSARDDDWDLQATDDVYLLPAEGGEPTRLTHADGTVGSPSFSPDGQTIAFLYTKGIFDDPRHTQIATIPAAGGEIRTLTASLDRNCGPYFEGIREPIWEDGGTILFGVEDSGNVHLYRVAADGSTAPELVVGGDLMLVGYDAVGGTIVHAYHTATSLTELFAGDRKLTEVGDSFAQGRELPAPERFTAVSPDGSEVEAWLIRPVDFDEAKKYPVLFNIHGGPFSQYGNKFFDEFQIEAAAGYAVLYSNPRGSSGYSESWGRAIRGPVGDIGPGWGTVDYNDCMAVVDEALKRFDFLDADRMGVLGGSYGGYMTSWIVGHTDRFAAAISERAVNDMITEDQAADFATFFKGEIGGFWYEAIDEYRQVSPITYAEKITTPLLILHSEDDLRCPIPNGEALFGILRRLKREVEFVRFPAEGHELSRSGSPRHRVQRFEIVLDWMDRHLKNGLGDGNGSGGEG